MWQRSSTFLSSAITKWLLSWSIMGIALVTKWTSFWCSRIHSIMKVSNPTPVIKRCLCLIPSSTKVPFFTCAADCQLTSFASQLAVWCAVENKLLNVSFVRSIWASLTSSNWRFKIGLRRTNGKRCLTLPRLPQTTLPPIERRTLFLTSCTINNFMNLNILYWAAVSRDCVLKHSSRSRSINISASSSDIPIVVCICRTSSNGVIVWCLKA